MVGAMPKEIRIPFTQIRIGRFMFLLVSITLMLALRPFLEGLVGVTLLMDVFMTLIVLSGVYAVRQNNLLFSISMVFALPALGAHWMRYFVDASSFLLVGEIFSALFFTFIVIVCTHHLFTQKRVTPDVIAGGVCGYLLIGLMWGAFFMILDTLQPGSFKVGEEVSEQSSYLTYYSYVTLTTLGYGDITPITSQARSVSILEAIVGPIYLTILVARLVAMQVSQSMQAHPPQSSA